MMDALTPFRPDQNLSPDRCPEDGCVKTGYHYVDVSVPLELKPRAELGEVEAECSGEPSVECREGRSGDSCRITITQKISIKIPIHYQVTACMGESSIDCDGDSPCCQ